MKNKLRMSRQDLNKLSNLILELELDEISLEAELDQVMLTLTSEEEYAQRCQYISNLLDELNRSRDLILAALREWNKKIPDHLIEELFTNPITKKRRNL